MTAQIAYLLKCRSRVPLRVVAREAFAAHLRHRLTVRVVKSHGVLAASDFDLAACVADALKRFDESTGISNLLRLSCVDGIAYILEGLANAIAYRERKERLKRLTSAGRPPKSWAMVTSCHWALMELDPPERMSLLSRLIEDFLDESVDVETLRNQINQAEIRRAEKRRREGLPGWKMTAAFRRPAR